MRWLLCALSVLSGCTQVDRDPAQPAARPHAVAPVVTTPRSGLQEPGGYCPHASTGADIKAAREIFKVGRELYERGEYLDAAACFRLNHDMHPRPEVAYNIGQTYRKSGHNGLARKYLELYLTERPDGPQAPEVRKMLADLPP